MACAFRKGSQLDEWPGPAHCALKLVKLAVGTFEPAHVLDDLSSGQSKPSWISEHGPTSADMPSKSFPRSAPNRNRTVRESIPKLFVADVFFVEMSLPVLLAI